MNTKGFTLIEVLIGLFIAVLASLSVAQVIASTNKVVDAGRKTFIATNLAHEGLELTREIRDDTWFKDPVRANWMNIFCPNTNPSNIYTISADKARTGEISTGDAKKELFVKSSGEWSYDSNTGSKDSGYARVMTIDCSDVSRDPAFVTVTSKVSWMGASGNKEVSLTEKLYNWMP